MLFILKNGNPNKNSMFKGISCTHPSGELDISHLIPWDACSIIIIAAWKQV